MANESDNWLKFGNWVKKKREAKGLRQEDLAGLAGFSDRQSIYRIEAGASTKRSSVVRIAKALGENHEEALSIAFGVPEADFAPPAYSPPRERESDRQKREREAQAARMAEMAENFLTLSPERQQQAIELVKVLQEKHPEALEALGPTFRIVTPEEWLEQRKKAGPDVEETDDTKDTHDGK